jgi:hypothetical protein
MQNHLVTLSVCGLLMVTASQAAAQGPAWTDRAYFGLNFAVQSGSTDLDGTRTFTIYDEQARISTTGKGEAGPMIDLSGGARVWRNVSVGIGFQKLSSKSDATVEGAIPHPLFFNRPRNFTESVPSLERSESAVHLQFGYTWVVNPKIDVLVYGGPSFFRLSQDVVSNVEAGERGFPFDSVITQTSVRRQKENPVGGHVGADVTYKLYTYNKITLGAGGFLRWAGASTDLRVLDSDVSSDVGGMQVGFGLRVRY